jgi:hypothetical protein
MLLSNWSALYFIFIFSGQHDHQKEVEKVKKVAEHEAGNAAKAAGQVRGRGMGNRGGTKLPQLKPMF